MNNDLPALFLCDHPKAKNIRNEMIKNQIRISECEQNVLEDTFFSDENMDLINKQLIISVFKKTNGYIKISEQSKSSLLIIMRYVFIEYAKHLPYNIAEQIKELNCRVVNEVVPNIITNATQHINYIAEINGPRKVISLPQNVRFSYSKRG